jgi:multidrug efflux pump subunit AcrB
MRRFVAAFARNTVFTTILLLLILVAGLVTSQIMIRERFPDFNIDVVLVQVPWPGADPEEVEEGIAIKIEEAVNGLEGVKNYRTESLENLCIAYIEVLESYDVDEVREDVSSRVDAIPNLPIDAEKPVVRKGQLELNVIGVALRGAKDERRLKEWAEEVREELQELPEVSNVKLIGAREYEISIEVSEERLREYDLTFAQVADAVRAGSQNLPGGTLRTSGEEIRLRTVGRKYWGDEFGNIVVMATPRGDIITLDQVAEIRDGFTEDRIAAFFNDERAVICQVYKTPKQDAIVISNQVRAWVAEHQKTLPEGLEMEIWDDTSYFIRGCLNVLTKNSILGLIVVFLLLWLFMDLRLSFWASMGIPVSLAGALVVLWLLGTTLNIVSLFGLIMVVGIIVDDAIVVGEAIYVHRQRGDHPLAAAVNGVMEVGMPVMAAVGTTIIAFIPLLFVGGFMGKFIRFLPWAVIACLVVSTFECMLMLPSHLSHLPDFSDPEYRKRQQQKAGRRLRVRIARMLENFAEHVYQPAARMAIRRRYLSICIAVAIMLIAAGFYKGGMLKFVMFPPIDGNMLITQFEFPSGTPLSVTSNTLSRLDAALRRVEKQMETATGEPLVTNVFATAGQHLKDIPGQERTTGTEIGGMRVELLKAERRGVNVQRIINAWEREVGEIPGIVSLSIERADSGMPAKPIEIWLSGKDMNEIAAAADALSNKLAKFKGISQVGTDFRPGKNEIRFRLKPAATALGLTVGDLARQVYAGFYGEEALRLQRGRDDIRVRVRYPMDERNTLPELYNIRIRSPYGAEVPLRSVADLEFGPGFTRITRTNGNRRIAVTADTDTTRANTAEVIADLRANYFGQFRRQFPGIRLEVRGDDQATNESLGTLVIGFPMALLFIFFIVATIFRSYAQPFIIMITVPFGIVGAIIGHLLLGYPITLFSVFGIVALAGVVVNDAIVFIECINNLIAEGVPFFDALARGGVRRFRAIFLTTISTCGGLTPMMLETDLQTQFIIPMAISLSFGVAFATFLTLLLIPSLLAVLNDLRRLRYWMKTGAWPSREEVEPAISRKADPLAESDRQANMVPAGGG